MNEADALKHYGVLGMKWGVRKDRGHEGEKATTRKIAKADKKYEKQFSGTKGYVKVQNQMASLMNEKLDVLNANPKYQTDLLAPGNEKIYAAYLNEYERMVESSAAEATRAFGSNASGTHQFVVRRQGEGAEASWVGRLEELNHADESSFYILIKPTFDSRGRIKSQTIKAIVDDGSAAHSEYLEYDNSLAHYGVLGMKWGVRKDKPNRNARNDNYSDQQIKRDRQIYGVRGTKRINRSLNDGNRISVARGDETVRRNAALRTNRPARVAGKATGTVVGAGVGYVGHRLVSELLVSPDVVKFTTGLLGNAEAYFITRLLTNGYTRLAVASGAAQIGNLLGGDAGVALNMRLRGYDPNRK